MGEQNGAWIFLSHSAKDWDEVREVRNRLEERGHRPLVFFLKCLTEHSELDELIRREIDARSWFLLCDSENAQQSSWVQEEVAYIKSLQGKYYEQIHLDDTLESQIERIDRLCKRATVFLSYSQKDRLEARRIQEALDGHDYSAWLDFRDIGPGTNWQQEIEGAIDRAVERGFVLVLLSPNAVQSGFVTREIRHALDKASKATHGANIIPIMLHDARATQAAMPPDLQRLLGDIEWFDFSRGEFEANMAALIAHMRSRAMD